MRTQIAAITAEFSTFLDGPQSPHIRLGNGIAFLRQMAAETEMRMTTSGATDALQQRAQTALLELLDTLHQQYEAVSTWQIRIANKLDALAHTDEPASRQQTGGRR